MNLRDLLQPIIGKKKSAHKIKTGTQLLSPHKKSIKEIQSIVGLQQKYWNYFYLKTLQNVAEFVQELPASEAHHHSGRGGLLLHTLETASNALRLRRGKLLPPNADAETVTKLKDAWTYAIFTAALCHDLGKPITDVRVEFFDKSKKPVGNWQPLSTSMLDQSKLKGATTYQVQYWRNRIYASHERASAFYVHNIIPPEGLQWIASNQELFFYWTSMMTGHHEDAGMVGNIIHEADKLSVASNLAGDQVDVPDQNAATSRKPLYQRIVTSLRFQVDQGHLPLNRDGAAGWIVDDKLWVVVKRALDQVRDHMTREGQSGIPSRNDRIMDELQQYGILIPNGDKAVWKCQVFDTNWPKAHELTLLCLPVEKTWVAADAVPEAFQGTVKPLDQPEPTEPSAQATNEPTHTVQTGPEAVAPINHSQDDIGAQPDKQTAIEEISKDKSQPTTSQSGNLQPPTIDFSSMLNSIPDPVDEPEDEVQQSAKDSIASTTVSTDSLITIRPAPEGPKPRTKKTPAITEELSKNISGDGFLKWLRDGLHTRGFKVNDVKSRIHIPPEGLLLVSPAIFKQFDQAKWSYAQTRFTKLKLHERNSNGTNIHEYIASGKKKRSMIKGFLITDTANVFPGIELPKTNHALSKIAP